MMTVNMASAIVVRVCAKKSDVPPFSTRRSVCFMKMGNTGTQYGQTNRWALDKCTRTYNMERGAQSEGPYQEMRPCPCP